MDVQMMSIKDVHPYPDNPRKIPKEAIEAVAKSIQTFGWQQPIVVDKDNTIIVGHTRYKAAQKLKLKEVPVVVADLDQQKADEYRIVDNRVAEFSTWNYDGLLKELQSIFDIDMTGFGFAGITADGDTGEGGGAELDDGYQGLSGTSIEIDPDEYADEHLPIVCPNCGFRFTEGD